MKTGLSPSSEGKCPREMQRCRALCRNLWLMAAYRLWPQAMCSSGAVRVSVPCNTYSFYYNCTYTIKNILVNPMYTITDCRGGGGGGVYDKSISLDFSNIYAE
jgi:hypothetical protein